MIISTRRRARQNLQTRLIAFFCLLAGMALLGYVAANSNAHALEVPALFLSLSAGLFTSIAVILWSVYTLVFPD